MKNIKLVNRDTYGYSQLAPSMFELRHQVFKERLDWEVISENNQEMDEYDQHNDTNYVLVTNRQEEQDVIGCMRLIPTTKPYMLKNTFNYLMDELEIPESEDVWEISRFAVNKKDADNHSLMGFGKTTQFLAKGMCDFAIKNKISYYIGLTTPQIERLIKNLGLNCVRVGQIQKINELKVVIIKIIMDEKSINSVHDKLLKYVDD